MISAAAVSQLVMKVIAIVAQASQITRVQVVMVVVALVIRHVLINAYMAIALIVQLVIVAINVQTVKLATHNVIQTISDYFYALLYCFLQLILIHINYLLIV